jgi:hypothetical protein
VVGALAGVVQAVTSMVGAVAGVVGAVASVVGAVADEDMVNADRICTSSVVVAVKRLTPVIWPTVNERPSAMVTESGMMTILLAWVGSLPRGMPKVVICQWTGAQATN